MRRSALYTWLLLPFACIPVGGAAQEPHARCPVVAHRTPPAARDSLLHSLDPEEIALTGFVRDQATGEPVPDMIVVFDGTGTGTMTAEDGSYLIRRLDSTDGLERPLMVKACDLAWQYLSEVREVMLVTPWLGTVVVIDGRTMPNPGHAVRLDFVVRRRPNVF